jgi:DNA gyrase subunit B
MLTSEEIKNLVVAIGAGIQDSYNPAKIRYHRIIIMADADVDGAHIRTLLLTLFYRYFQDVILRGYLYIAQPPLFGITGGKDKFYAYTEEERDDLLKTMKGPQNIQRYKGLSEMNPEQLWDTTMNPDNRVLHKVSIDDAAKADEIFSMLMGDEVGPRKRFIQTHAKAVKNLDI